MRLPDRSAGKRRWAAVPTALLLAVATLVALPPQAAQAAGNLYVGGRSCSDAGSGSKFVPFCTISAAAARAVAGQTVRVNSGTYSETVTPARSGIAGAPIRYRPNNGASVTITGGTYGFEIKDVSWITVTGFKITGTASNGVYLKNGSHVDITGNRVERAGVRVAGLNAAGIYVDDTVDSTLSTNVVADNSSSGIYLTGEHNPRPGHRTTRRRATPSAGSATRTASTCAPPATPSSATGRITTRTPASRSTPAATTRSSPTT